MTTLYQLEHSPFCIPVVALFRALNKPLETVSVSNGDRRQILELTGGASYEVPLLADGGRLVFESGAETQDVARHIDSAHAAGRLFPKALDGLQALILHHLENEVEGVTFRLVEPFYIDSITDVAERGMVRRHKERKFGRGCVEAWKREREPLLAAALECLRPYEAILENTPFLLGAEPVYADFLLYGLLGNLTWGGHNPFPVGLPALARWHRRLEAFRF